MAIYNLALYYRWPEAFALQGTKEKSFGSLEGKQLRCKIKLQKHLSHTELHAQVTMDWGSASLLPSVTTTGGRTAVRTMFAQASNAFLSPLDTQKKKPVEDFRDSHSQVLETLKERQKLLGNTLGSQLRFTHFHFTIWLEMRWVPLWNELYCETGKVCHPLAWSQRSQGQILFAHIFLEVARSAGGAGSCWILLASQGAGW